MTTGCFVFERAVTLLSREVSGTTWRIVRFGEVRVNFFLDTFLALRRRLRIENRSTRRVHTGAEFSVAAT